MPDFLSQKTRKSFMASIESTLEAQSSKVHPARFQLSALSFQLRDELGLRVRPALVIKEPYYSRVCGDDGSEAKRGNGPFLEIVWQDPPDRDITAICWSIWLGKPAGCPTKEHTPVVRNELLSDKPHFIPRESACKRSLTCRPNTSRPIHYGIYQVFVGTKSVCFQKDILLFRIVGIWNQCRSSAGPSDLKISHSLWNRGKR